VNGKAAIAALVGWVEATKPNSTFSYLLISAIASFVGWINEM
jgi:hypothetical protein